MADSFSVDLLLDFYGMLLTENQQKSLEMYYSDDMSFAEIAEELGISRQGAYDTIRRGRNQLAEYEEKLGLVARFRETGRMLDAICGRLSSLAEDGSLPERVRNEAAGIRAEIGQIAGRL